MLQKKIETIIKVTMKEIESIDQLIELLSDSPDTIKQCAFQNLDMKEHESLIAGLNYIGCIFMGCNLSAELTYKLINSENLVFPKMDVPFETYPAKLYTRETLYNNFDPEQPESYNQTYDKIVYDHYVENGRHSPASIYETLARRLHDHSITDALMDILNTIPPKKIVAIMGGHSLSRNSPDYFKVAHIAKELSEKGFFLLTGGGPGAMEAAHLGTWFDSYPLKELQDAIETLSQAPMYNDTLWLQKAFNVIDRYPKQTNKENDIGIPTWLYGHEPPTPFASKIAKYFANSDREEGLLALAKGGIIYTPGSAGTVQEIFQDATQNHYNSYGIISPMIFFNKRFWTEDKPVYPLLQKLAEGYEYGNLLSISDDVDEIVEALIRFEKQK
jgi:predicted Rossmann-fold nucleotide-binding protein